MVQVSEWNFDLTSWEMLLEKMPMGNELKELLKEGDGGTVKSPNKGHIGDGPFVPSKEVFLFSEVLF